ncbi:MAG: RnfABCDGE type electron transport complex subunit G [Nanoarchaeota archaeon]|nr:RnfABCDGE type electron transport complex subunit G [Nanoarchaeota archaeon]
MNEMMRLGITLMIVTLVASAGLAVTNHITSPQIEYQNELAVKRSLNKVIAADSFEKKQFYYDAYIDGNLIGRVLEIEAPGYSSTIQALVGIDQNDEITGVDIVYQQETPGLGANIEKEPFLKQFIGMRKDSVKIKKDGGEIDAITGATISSRAIADAIAGKISIYDAKTAASPILGVVSEEMVDLTIDAELDELDQLDADLDEISQLDTELNELDFEESELDEYIDSIE